MSRFLYLMRHAQSADKQPGQPDKERELTQQGMHDAMFIGRQLAEQKINLDLVVSSTANRAKHTTELVTEILKFNHDKIQFEDELYTASARTFLELITQLGETFINVMCVGHNPVISYLAEYLTKAEIGDLPPAGIVIIKCNVTHWKDMNQGSGEFINLLTPGNFSHE